jgi:hypothetical protein
LRFTRVANSWPSVSKQEEKNMKDEQGDVPGWVLITLMTAGLVVLMWSIAGPALKTVFEQALTKVATF